MAGTSTIASLRSAWSTSRSLTSIRRQQRWVREHTRRQQIARIASGGEQLADTRRRDLQWRHRQLDQSTGRQCAQCRGIFDTTPSYLLPQLVTQRDVDAWPAQHADMRDIEQF